MLDKIYEILESQNGVPISAGTIGKILSIDQDATHFPVRKMIRQLMKERLIPIGACPSGYYLIRNESQLNNYKDRLKQRLRKTSERINLLNKAFYGG